VPLSTREVPQASVSSFLDFTAVRSYTWTRDIVGSGKAFSPKDGLLETAGEWTSSNMFPTTSLSVPHVFRSFLFRKLDNFANPCPLIGEFTFDI